MTIVIIMMAAMLLCCLLFLGLALLSLRKAPMGKALIRRGLGGTIVQYDGSIYAFPLMHKLEEIDISLQSITIHCTGQDKLISKDQIAFEAKATFYLLINKTKADILQVAETLGCARASNPEALHNLFYPKFIELLKFVAKDFIFVELKANPPIFKDAVLAALGDKIHGFEIQDLSMAINNG